MFLYHQKLGRLWWLKNIRYFVYFVRELSGVVLAGYVFYLIFFYLSLNPFYFGQDVLSDEIIFRSFTLVALVFALIHTVTWLYASAKIFAFKVGNILINYKILFVFLICLWLIVSWLMFNYLYDRII